MDLHYSIALLVHIVAGVVLACGNAAALASTVFARRTVEPATILTLLRMHRAVVNALVIPGAIAVLASGLWVTAPAGVDLGAGWMIASFVIWVVALVIGVAILVPEQGRAIDAATRLVAAGATEGDEELRKHVAAPAIVIGEWAQQGLILVFLYLMVFQPGGS